MFDDDFDDHEAHDARVLRTLEAQDVPVVVLFDHGDHSGPPNRGLVDALERRYPTSKRFGSFTVRWRTDRTR